MTSERKGINFRRIGLPALIIAAVVYGLFFIPWLILTGLLFLSYTPADAPFTYLTTLMYPLFAIGSVGASFVFYRRNQFQVAFLLLFIPLINICLLFLSFVPIWPRS
jgi:hypothetical protein